MNRRGNGSPNSSVGDVEDMTDEDQDAQPSNRGNRGAAARDMASAGMRFLAGRGATSPLPPSLPATSPLRNPIPSGETAKNQLCFLTKEDISSRWCLGLVNGASGTRFCMGEKRPGSTHCGIKNHGSGRGRASKTKFQPQEDCFYILGGSTNGQPMAKKEPVLHWEDVPIHQRGLLKNASRTTREWTAIFEDIITKNELEDSEVRDVN